MVFFSKYYFLITRLPLYCPQKSGNTIYLSKSCLWWWCPKTDKHIIRILCYLHQWFRSRDNFTFLMRHNTKSGYFFCCLSWRNSSVNNEDWFWSNVNCTIDQKLCSVLCKINTHILTDLLTISQMFTQVLGAPL